MIRAEIIEKLLANAFVKSLLPIIAKDVAFSGAVIKEQVILKAQQLGLVYSQSQILYQIIPNALRSDIYKSMPGPHADGVTGSIGNIIVNQAASQMGQMSMYSNLLAASSYAQPTSVALGLNACLQDLLSGLPLWWGGGSLLAMIGPQDLSTPRLLSIEHLPAGTIINQHAKLLRSPVYTGWRFIISD